MMLRENMSSAGRPPENELCERLMHSRLARLVRNGEMCPPSPLDSRETPVTAPSPLQEMPSHSQQSVPLLRQDVARPPSRGSLARNLRRFRLSCSVHAVAGEAKKSSRNSCSTTGGTVNEHIDIEVRKKRQSYGLKKKSTYLQKATTSRSMIRPEMMKMGAASIES